MVIITGVYAVFFWDYHLSKYLFKQYCEEEGRVGIFVYEQVALSDEYFIPFPIDKDPRYLPRKFVMSDNLMIREDKLTKDFLINTKRKDIVSEVGPIYSYTTTIVRKSDGKVLSKAVSLKNELGWQVRSRKALFPSGGEECPKGVIENGSLKPNFDHYDVVNKVFLKKIRI